MTRSIHDNLIVSYEVRCEDRVITLRTRFREEGKPAEHTNVVFNGVQCYHFENDAFGNIIFDVSEIPIKQFLTEHSLEVSELYRMTGSPAWAVDLSSVPDRVLELGIKVFTLSSSRGLSGWVVAREISIVSAG
jgi:hypothetical protein